MTKSTTTTPFERLTEEDLYPGFEPKNGPDIGAFWDPEKMETSAAWNPARTMWERVCAYHRLHSANYIPIPTAYEIPRPLRLWADRIIHDGETPKPLLVYGSVGVGKTHGVCAMACYLAAFWARTLFVDAPPIAFHTASMLMSQLKDYGGREAREALLHSTLNAKVLVIDDLTRAKITDHDMETLGQIMDGRTGKQLPTIFTVNHLPDQDLTDLMPQFLASRLESGSSVVLYGPDRRAA